MSIADESVADVSSPVEASSVAVEAVAESQNPHVEWFNWSRSGYTTVEFTDNAAVYTAYEVDRTVDAADAPKRLLRAYRVPEGEVELQEFSGSQTDVTSATSSATDDTSAPRPEGSGDD